ncbi:hypothetical protein [Mesorhizobium sp. M7A.F.Ca.US.006.01.1.1]|uniref:hypothetical protein n=1 Tax=Mesorhizobium sp. M7A.F.Ca.US.006.01.1.1 TaxID=2496707 RepID=UPI000FCB4163|nr:hypothetical protein [Mesorhizobium sp. M7A.F.Ca.US.006.01.1.1]
MTITDPKEANAMNDSIVTSKRTPKVSLSSSMEFYNRDGSKRKNASPFVELMTGLRKKTSSALQSGADPIAARAELQKVVAGKEWTGARSIPANKSIKKLGRNIVSEAFLSSSIRVSELADSLGTIHFRDQPGDGSWGQDVFGTRIDLASVGWYWDAWAEATDDGLVKKIETYQNVDTSKMGGFVRAENFSPDGRDYISGHAESGFCWDYTPSRDCHLEIRALVVETYSRSRRRLSDQWMQVSNCQVNQENYITAGYFSSGIESYGKVFRDVGPSSAYVGDGDHSQSDDSQYGTNNTYYGNPDVDIVTRGDSRTLEVSISPIGQMYKDRTVNCFLGARSQMFASLDDVTADLWQGGTWKVIELFVREI